MARKRKAEGATPKPTKRGAMPRSGKKSTKGATPAADKTKPHVAAHNELYSPAQIIMALQNSAGLVSVAARTLRCGRVTIYRYMERYPEIQQALDEIREDTLDIAEAGIINFMSDDKHPTLKQKSCEFYLRTMGKTRGYTTGTEVTGKGGGAIETDNKVTLDLSGLSADELAMLEKNALLISSDTSYQSARCLELVRAPQAFQRYSTACR